MQKPKRNKVRSLERTKENAIARPLRRAIAQSSKEKLDRMAAYNRRFRESLSEDVHGAIYPDGERSYSKRSSARRKAAQAANRRFLGVNSEGGSKPIKKSRVSETEIAINREIAKANEINRKNQRKRW